MMQNQPAGPKASLKSAQVICAALMICPAFFAIISAFINEMNAPPMGEEILRYKNVMMYAAIGIAGFCAVLSRVMYNKKLTIVKNTTEPLHNKLNQYSGALILYMAPCEGAAIVSVALFFLTGDHLLFLITGAMLALMLYKFPFVKKAIAELGLDWQEQQALT